MILHTINKSPFRDNTLADCLRLCSPGDAVLFIEDGVYAAQQHTRIDLMIELHSQIDFFALQPDLEARGLSTQNSTISSVNDADFVELTVKYNKVQSWY